MIPRYTRPEMAADLGPRDALSHLVRDRGARGLRHGRAGPDPQERGQGHLGQGLQGQVRHGPHRRDRARGQARRHRLPHAPGRARRTRGALRALRASPPPTSSTPASTCSWCAPPTCCSPTSTRLLAALEKRALEHKLTPTVGRSHGIHAEPTTFGLKLAQAYAEFARAKERLTHARAEVATCAISGAVGTFANVDPRVEAYVADKMGLSAGADLHAGDPARPARHVLRHARRHRLVAGAAGDRDPAPAAHRGAGGGGVLLGRAEGLLRHAAQAQPRR